MAQSNADRTLLFGMLALQMDFVTRDALIAAMETWVLEKDQPLGKVLRSQGALAEDDDRLLDSLVRRLLEKHGDEAPATLAAVSPAAGIQEVLEQIGDLEIELSAGFLANLVEEIKPNSNSHDAYPFGAAVAAAPRFRLVESHDRGGQGEVWIAEDAELHRRVALKRLRPHCADDPESQLRFVHEAEVTGRLEHRGIVPVYGVGRFENGHPFYAMRFVEGTSLGTAIVKFHEARAADPAHVDRPLELRRLLGRFVDACNTVAYAHSRGVLHRDLKPGNIILDEYGETLVVDWGLAKSGYRDLDPASTEVMLPTVSAGSAPSTLAGTTVGTPAFMSPEQAAGPTSVLGPATDVYSLGATLYCVLTGKPPFAGRDPDIILPQVREGAFLRPRQLDSSVPVALEAICLKAMALTADARYPSPRALGDDIERWLANQPVLAYPEPLPARGMRWVRRRKHWVAAAAAMLILSVLGLAIHDWQITRERDKLSMTRDVLREQLKVSGENLAVVPNTEKLREYLANLLLDRYRQISDKFGADPVLQFETAQVLRVLGGIGRITGQDAKSQECYEKAIKVLTTLCGNDPGRSEYRRCLADAFNERGELNHMTGRTLEAERDFQAVVVQANELLSMREVTSDLMRTKASALINLSEIYVLKNELPNAHKAADQAVELLRPLAEPETKSKVTSNDRWLLSLALTDRGIAFRESGKDDRAHQDFDAAAQLAASIAQDDEVFEDSQYQLACIANERGELLTKDQSRLAESESSFEQASQILARLIKDHNAIPHYREEMAVTLHGRAAVRLAMARTPDAQRDCEAALDQLGSLIGEQTRKGIPENPAYLSLLGQILELQSRIHFLQREQAEGRRLHVEAMEKLSRAIGLDPARAVDKIRLEQMCAGPARPEM